MRFLICSIREQPEDLLPDIKFIASPDHPAKKGKTHQNESIAILFYAGELGEANSLAGIQ